MKNTRKNLVLLHGHGVDDSIWDEIYLDLHDEYTIIKPNFSAISSFSSIDEYADELHRLLLSTGIEKVTIIGHSMGGYIALAFADKYSSMLEGIGLFHSTSSADNEEKKEQRLKIAALLLKQGSEAFLRLTGPNLFGGTYKNTRTKEFKKYLNQYGQLPAQALAGGVVAMRSRPDRTHLLSSLTVPVLFILGMQDTIMPFEQIMPLTKLPKEAHHFILAEAGHMGMVEAPQATARIIRYFMEQID